MPTSGSTYNIIKLYFAHNYMQDKSSMTWLSNHGSFVFIIGSNAVHIPGLQAVFTLVHMQMLHMW